MSAPTITGSRCWAVATIRRSRIWSRARSSDFAANSVLLDFTAGRDNPATPYIGAAIREECGLDEGIKYIEQVPSRSLLSRLTDHYLQIIANRAPIGFEAEFVNQRGDPICYRGILMPFSSDGDTIDFIYGVINWKRGEGAATTQEPPQAQVEAAPEFAPVDDDEDELILEEAYSPPLPSNDTAELAEEPVEDEAYAVASPTVHFAWEDGPLHDPESDEPVPEIASRSRRRPRRPAVGGARDRRCGEGRRRPHPLRALPRALARL